MLATVMSAIGGSIGIGNDGGADADAVRRESGGRSSDTVADVRRSEAENKRQTIVEWFRHCCRVFFKDSNHDHDTRTKSLSSSV